MSDKPREFWIKFDPEIDRISAVDWSWNLYVHSREPSPDMLNQAEHLHVIEKSAYDALKAENERLYDEYYNVCKFATQYEQERDALKAENARLKTELKITCELKGAGISHNLFDMVCCERDTAHAERDRALAMLEKMAGVLELVKEISESQAVKGIFEIAAIHGCTYFGKQYGVAVDEALEQYRREFGEKK